MNAQNTASPMPTCNAPAQFGRCDVSNPVFPIIDLGELTSNASDDAFHWLCDAVRLIDENMGHGYAAKHPAMVTGFMNAAALSYQAERQVDAAEMITMALLKLAKERGTHG